MGDLVIENGHVIDPESGLSGKADIAISNGTITAVEAKISSSGAKRVIDASGLIVTPGLVDIHTHVAHDVVRLSVDPDAQCLMKGVTTAVDAGSTGELNFAPFKRYVVDRVRTRVFAFLNIESLGMVEFGDMPGYTDQEWPELITESGERFGRLFVNLENTTRKIEENRQTIVGIKWAHHGFKVMEKAREAATAAGCRLMIENRFMPEASHLVQKGDTVTHVYHDAFNRHSGRKDGLIQDGKIPSEFFEMAKRGVNLDVGHGKGSFSWEVAESAFAEGLRPTTISTDLWSGNVEGPVHDLPTVMSKFLHLGMSVEEVVAACTVLAAAAIGRGEQVGGLKPGSPADIALFRLKEGSFALEDCYGDTRKTARLLVPTHVIRAGKQLL